LWNSKLYCSWNSWSKIRPQLWGGCLVSWSYHLHSYYWKTSIWNFRRQNYLQKNPNECLHFPRTSINFRSSQGHDYLNFKQRPCKKTFFRGSSCSRIFESWRIYPETSSSFNSRLSSLKNLYQSISGRKVKHPVSKRRQPWIFCSPWRPKTRWYQQ